MPGRAGRRAARRLRAVAALAVALASVGACHRRDEEPPPLAPNPGQWQPPRPPPTAVLPPGVPALGSGPALGFPCGSDADLACTFSKCIAGRCGGCRSQSDCKVGMTCAWTPLGTACLPGFVAGPPASTGAPPFTPAPAPTAAPSGPLEQARAICLAHTNELRARVGAAPLARVISRESCTDDQARSDGGSGRAHGAFGRCSEGAQNECPGWPGAPQSMVASCLDAMFAEGPGEPYSAHGHYINMTSGAYAGVACGFSTDASGQVWMVQDFYPSAGP